MTADSLVSLIVDVVKRQWWIVLLVVAVSLVVAFGLSSDAGDVYTGRARILIDNTSTSRYRGMPLPDDVVRHVSDSEVREAVAEETGLDADAAASGLRASASGNPLTQIIVDFTHEDEQVAEDGALVATEKTIEWILDSAAEEIEWRESQIDSTLRAIDALSDDPEATPAEREETAYKRWQLETKLLDYEATLRAMVNVYAFDGAVDVSVQAGTSTLQRDLLGAAVIGVFVGLLLAAAREALTRRRAAA